ncbi:hypothetical protein [Mucilaginibacter sp.]|uniref:hypothetical protein n=1 Tax=Mucilaginibacter sp. TaxID=1882438 RepID=UPI000CB9C312|nr:hypothetical protein [Mucilaginibacter sp.]PLW90047.1 MAG: hypothetical protein C0154_08460 [Mucilaginibacter sp.]PMP64612.1 MAG: hypothetical protein C0191_06075 [Mucilaginibacter sp.]HEK20797.1 hypothetical protein [Bacteroidota bacterium]
MRRLNEWLISHGKTKSSILYVLFWVLFIITIIAVHGVINHHNIIDNIRSNKVFLLFATLLLIAHSGKYYDDKVALKKEEEQLSKKGLTRTDIDNINFVKRWTERRGAGFIKYVLFNGGLLLGSIFFLAISIAFFPATSTGGRQFPEFSDMINWMVKCWGIGFTVGALLCIIIWNLSERKFKRLTAANIFTN